MIPRLWFLFSVLWSAFCLYVLSFASNMDWRLGSFLVVAAVAPWIVKRAARWVFFGY